MTYSIIIANKFVNYKLIKTIKSIAIQKCLKETEVVIVNKDKNNSLKYLSNLFSNIKFKKTDIGESVSCNGVCLTLIRIKKKSFLFYLSKETLIRSNFKDIKKGKKINIEKSLLHGQKISGYYVQGHVDTTARITDIKVIDKSWVITAQLKDSKFNKYLVEKASITINGVSLTISNLYKRKFQISVIPHTLKLTNLKNLKKNDLVNVELDI